MAKSCEYGKRHMKRPPASLAVAAAIGAALIAAFGTWYAAKWQAEKQAAITLSFAKEQFEARLKEYPKLFKILLPLSRQNADQLTPEKAKCVSEDLNRWFYDCGGLVAHPNTRSAVYQLREVCAHWESGPRPASIDVIKDAVIYSCRNDLDLISRIDISLSDLDGQIKKRNENIKKVQVKAGLLQE